MATFDKTGDPAALAFEAAGLRWLGAAEDAGGAPVVTITDEGEGWLELQHLDPVEATSEAAASLGRGLARTHGAGAPSLGCAPPGWHGEVVRRSGPMPLHEHDEPAPPTSWGEFYARYQILPYIERARAAGAIDADGARILQRLAERLADHEYDHDQPRLVTQPAARLHGDLWGGNVVFSQRGGVLIDPAAHGGHAETDLAALALFGVPHLADIRAGYQEVSPLADGWQDRIGLHQLTMLIMHAVIFGGSYGPHTIRTAQRYA